jgi:2-haloacid dehalogenase
VTPARARTSRSSPARSIEDNPCVLITFDLFSALIDSRLGASAVLDGLAHARGWPVDGGTVHDDWDRRNKASQRDEPQWIPFAEHCRRALADTYRALDLRGAADDDVAVLLRSVGDWPLWPDVVEGLPAIAARHRVGILSNVDDDVFARTRVAALVEDDAVLTSERLRAYKPGPDIYRRARERAGGGLVHVATSARDVRGALEAGIETVRLRRPGHVLDPAGPQPEREAADLAALAVALDEIS